MKDSALQYLVDAKRQLADSDLGRWDLFISAFNNTDRVQKVFARVRAQRKVWWIIPEYGYSSADSPTGADVAHLSERQEADLVAAGFSISPPSVDLSKRVCIDITGFMRPHILFFLKYLENIGVKSFDMLYTEPEHYSRKADTEFALDDVMHVRQVAGFEGQHSPDMSNDVLIVGVGYDHPLVGRVILSKENARLIQLHCLPSLSADMYHESVLRLSRVSSIPASATEGQVLFSTANDPFITAAVLSESCEALSEERLISNLYLSPLATKPQALGFGLFFIRELQNRPASIIFPFSGKYNRETSTGIGRSWIYPVSL